MKTLIIISGDRYYNCGNVKVVGNAWTENHDLKMSICCDFLSYINVKAPISFDLFKFCLSRLRSNETPLVDKVVEPYGVFVNTRSIWMGKTKVIDFPVNTNINMSLIESKWNEYWKL